VILELPQGFWCDTVDSTMEEAKRLIQAGRIQGTAFVVANHQTEGRGTQGRFWSSPEARGIYLSVVHLPTCGETFVTTPLYTLAAGVACREAIYEVTGIETQLKPVNDIYVQGKKLGGILVESELQQNGITSLITGIGLNTHVARRTMDRGVVEPVSVEDILSPAQFYELAPETLVEALVGKVCFWYGLLFQGQQGQVERAWERYKLTEKL
jgi:biotin-[acetyl-CoA-carboxylase] ligase BirA-like protein